jgi:hypothetical protein
MTQRALQHMSDIQAVNMMLTTIGEQPIKNLNDNAGLQDASIAQDILHSTSRQVQSKGWIFNTDLQVTKIPNGKGKFVVEPNILRVDSTSKKRSTTEDIVERAGFLYDRENNTDVFATDATVVVDEVTFLPFNSLPEVARRYIAVKSARIFHDRIVGSGELHRFFQEDELTAWAELLEYQSEVGDFNIFDDYDTFRVVDRNQDANQQYAWRK